MVTNNKARALVCLCCMSQLGFSQDFRPPFRQATVSGANGQVTVHAFEPRPLDGALEAIRREFGWLADYEDPPYEVYDRVDDTAPAWRTQHPEAKGVTRVAGGEFTASFHVGQKGQNTDEIAALTEIVDAYNASGNPAHFAMRRSPEGRLSVVGVSVKGKNGDQKDIQPLLDQPLTLPLQERTLAETLTLITQLLSQTSGHKVVLGEAPTNLLLQTKVKSGGSGTAARTLLSQALLSSPVPLIWRLLYDGDVDWYALNLEPLK
jgi:hypothetical protein